jgi:hypothetical protein
MPIKALSTKMSVWLVLVIVGLAALQQPRISFGVCTLLAATGRAHGKTAGQNLTIVAPFLLGTFHPSFQP